MPQPILKVDNLTVEGDDHDILHRISFEALENETVAIFGPNGAGKTTLFRALLDLIPYTGSVTWKHGVKIGYVPQRLYIDTDLPITTKEFFTLKEKNIKEIERVLSIVGFNNDAPNHRHHFKPMLKRKLGVLSGGELQRILIAWALLNHPNVLLFDEPTSGVDISAEETIYSLLHKLQKQENLTILLISHELEVVYHYATNVICLNKESVCFGPPRKVIDKENLQKLFGSDFEIYQHH